MGFGLNIAQPATSTPTQALNNADNKKTVIDVGGGVNLGEMYKAFTQGSPENGGVPIVIPSRLAHSNDVSKRAKEYDTYFAPEGSVAKYTPYLLGIVILGGVAYAIYQGRR